MTPLKLTPALGNLVGGGTQTAAQAAPGQNFADLVQGMIKQTVQAQNHSEALTMAAAKGENIPLHEVVQAISQAQLTLQTLVTVRDRAVEAYQEVIRMPI
ncbi:MAG: flagellar hook-basal body complex protein FliE [Alphaproteobacteria bacterium]|jgi:flagellar hook-basal body complex protein FliE|nr:flagellar hook-basal body complex protein FliE [Alphaproteobacteria bacterium]